MWDTGINPAHKVSEEFKQQLNQLCKLSSEPDGSGSLPMTKEEIRQCFIIMRKNEDLRRRFRNPYIRKLRQNSLRGTMSKSND